MLKTVLSNVLTQDYAVDFHCFGDGLQVKKKRLYFPNTNHCQDQLQTPQSVTVYSECIRRASTDFLMNVLMDRLMYVWSGSVMVERKVVIDNLSMDIRTPGVLFS